jgi:hypothetical protein
MTWANSNEAAGHTIEAGGSPGAPCQGCHAQTQSNGSGNYRNVSLDYAGSNAKHAGTWGSSLVNADCENCHYAEHGGLPKLWIDAGTNHPAVPVENTHYFTFDKTTDDPHDVNQLCLSCHDGSYASLGAQDSDWQTASKFDSGGTALSMSSMWSNATTTMYSKYDPSTYNVTPQIEKAYSPHRYPDNNAAKASTHSYTNTIHLGCIECHPSHGSSLKSGNTGTGAFAGGYNTDTGASGGKMLAAENLNNETGNRYDGVGNPTYTSEEQLCWGCHPDGMDYRGDDSDTASSDLAEWQGTWNNSTHTVKTGGFRSSHFYPNRANMANSWTSTPSGDRTNISCSTCHDPHGVDTSGNFPSYMVPILRGSWLTSPYLEDSPPEGYQADTYWEWRNQANDTPSGEVKGARMSPDLADNRAPDKGHGYAANSDTGMPGYFIDDNTFGVYGGNTTTASGQDAGVWWHYGSAPANATDTVVNGNKGSKQNVYVKHMDSVATYPGGTQTQTVTAYDGVTNMTVGASLSANRVAGLCEACHLFDDTTSAGDLGNYTGHKTVVGIDSRSVWNVSWTKMFTRPYMHMKHRYDFATEIGGDTKKGFNYLQDCSRGDPKDKAGYHDGECGYHWGVDPEPARSVQDNYHKFSCSKCHTPHASRLPRLMQTNCLDVGSGSGPGSNVKHERTTGGGQYAYPWVDDGGSDSVDNFFDRYWTSQGPSGNVDTHDIAVTCHSNTDGSSIYSEGSNTPWNDVTPWQ